MANSNAKQNTNVGYYDSAQVIPRSKRVTKLNDDFEYLNKTNLRPNASNDEQFNAGYQKKGLQPQGIGTPEVKNAANNEQYSGPNDTESRQPNSRALTNLLSKKKAATLSKKILLRTKATTVNSSIFAWGGSLWFSVQLPFALLSLIMLVVMGTVSGLIAETGFIGSSVAWLGKQLADGVRFVSGIDVNLAAMADGLFIIPYVIVLAIGLFTIFGAFLQYTLAFLKPLSGEKAGLKYGLLLLALFGYCMPVLNLFPWALVWMAAVWKYPR